VSEIALIDANREKCEAEVLDITHGLSLGQAVKLTAADYAGCADAAVAVVTAGARQKPGESRIELLGRNAGMVREITQSILSSGFTGTILMISNPVDVLTWVAHTVARGLPGLPPGRVIGSGTVLDSSRLREFLARRCRINPMNIHGYVLGEHGDTSVPAWSLTTIGGVSFTDFCPACGKGCTLDSIKEEAAAYVRGAAETIIRVKGSTYYAIAQAASAIIQAVVRDERRILPVSTVRSAYRGVARTAFSFPTIVGAGGAEQVLDFPLSPEDQEALVASARYVSSVIEEAAL
jgi:L-lactate dehydrogenase